LFDHRENGFATYTLLPEHLMVGQREMLERNYSYRQIIAVSIFTHNGKVWAYERTKKGGESKLHNKVATCVGGHWDLADLVYGEDSVIDIPASLKKSFLRELGEEVRVKSNYISSRQHPQIICADDQSVDAKHICLITLYELDGELIESNEDAIKGMGFFAPEELLAGGYNLETWARLSCELLRDNLI
jgi:predicted NUDIX family phosphoesterase